jgi:hypothetical protein
LIGAAISYMSHSNKAGSATAKSAWFTGKWSRSTYVLSHKAYKISLSAYTWCIFPFQTRLVFNLYSISLPHRLFPICLGLNYSFSKYFCMILIMKNVS